MTWVQAIAAVLAGVGATLAVILQWPNTRGRRAILKRDLEILALLPESSAAREALAVSIDQRVEELVSRVTLPGEMRAEVTVGALVTAAGAVGVIVGVAFREITPGYFGAGMLLSSIRLWADILRRRAVLLAERKEPPAPEGHDGSTSGESA